MENGQHVSAAEKTKRIRTEKEGNWIWHLVFLNESNFKKLVKTRDKSMKQNG